MNQNKVTELLKDYRSYRYAVTNGENNTLAYGPRILPLLNSNRTVTINEWDYNRYSRIVKLLEGAVSDVLCDEEQRVIEHKYMKRNTLTLSQIGDMFHMSERRATYLHKKALKKLSLSLMFVDQPEIDNFDFMFDKHPPTRYDDSIIV